MVLAAESKTSFWEKVLDYIAPQKSLPPATQETSMDESAWAKSVEQARISDNLTAHDLGLIVFNESQSYSDRKDSNEPIDKAREKMAHAIINADEIYGVKRQKMATTALAVVPAAKALSNPNVRAAYDSSMKAAREAYLSGNDPTNGAVYLNQRPTVDRSNRVFPGGRSEGVPLRTQSGPYDNAYPNKAMRSRTAYLNTYAEK